MKIYDYTWDGAYAVMDDGCYLKLFAEARMSHYSTISIYDYSWHGLYVIMDDAVWNRSGKIHVYMADSRIVEIYDYVWDGAHNVMDDAIWNRLQKHAWPIPGPSNSWL